MMTNENIKLEVKDLNFYYGNFHALKSINMQIPTGKVTAFIGPSGCGKSTLLRIFNRMYELYPGLRAEGELLLDGKNILGRDVDVNLLRAKVGMVFQYAEQQLFEETVAKDIAFGPKNLGLSDEETAARVKEAMQLVHLDYETYAKRSPFALSGGQMRRVAIAGVLALQPEYLVLDEPVAGLDPRGREELIATIRHLHEKEHVTIVLVSHNMDDIARLADHVLIMSHGQLVCDAAPREAFKQRDMLKEAGLKVPHTMALMEQLRAKGLAVRTDCLTIEEAKKEILKAVKSKGGRSNAQ